MTVLTKLALILAAIGLVLLLVGYSDAALLLLAIVVFLGCVNIGDN